MAASPYLFLREIESRNFNLRAFWIGIAITFVLDLLIEMPLLYAERLGPLGGRPALLRRWALFARRLLPLDPPPEALTRGLGERGLTAFELRRGRARLPAREPEPCRTRRRWRPDRRFGFGGFRCGY